MQDLISRQAAIDALLEKGQRSRRYKLGDIWELNFDEIREAIATVPSAQPERKNGKWRDHQEGDWIYAKCSLCGAVQDSRSNFCPSCGAEMDEKESK